MLTHPFSACVPAAKAYFVSEAKGSDENGDGTQAKPFKTLNKVFQVSEVNRNCLFFFPPFLVFLLVQYFVPLVGNVILLIFPICVCVAHLEPVRRRDHRRRTRGMGKGY